MHGTDRRHLPPEEGSLAGKLTPTAQVLAAMVLPLPLPGTAQGWRHDRKRKWEVLVGPSALSELSPAWAGTRVLLGSLLPAPLGHIWTQILCCSGWGILDRK